jgi:hypothetical protein
MVPILLNLEIIVDGGTFNNLTIIIIFFLIFFGVMSKTNLANLKWCALGLMVKFFPRLEDWCNHQVD